jgi:hypothetical protein
MKILKSFDQTSQINNLEMLTCHHITQHVTNMKNKYSLFWKHKWTNSPKLHFLSTFKSEFKIEEYLNQVNNPTYRRLLTQFCVSCHTLNIEQGRYRKIPLEQRFCEFCDANETEDEFHFSLSCKYWKFHFSLSCKYFEKFPLVPPLLGLRYPVVPPMDLTEIF